MKAGTMLVTIFADASYCSKTSVAGWAGWAKSRRAQVSHSGKIRHRVHNSSEAEMCAIINAVVIAQKAGAALPGDTLLIESDSMDALGAFEHHRPMGKKRNKKSKSYARRKMLVEAFAQHTAGFELRFKHVKGHTGGADPRSYINKQCDKNARRHMKAARLERKSACQPITMNTIPSPPHGCENLSVTA